jgi:3-dehydroquinate dehydratase
VSHVAAVAKASLCGFGVHGYALAIDGLAALSGAGRTG